MKCVAVSFLLVGLSQTLPAPPEVTIPRFTSLKQVLIGCINDPSNFIGCIRDSLQPGDLNHLSSLIPPSLPDIAQVLEDCSNADDIIGCIVGRLQPGSVSFLISRLFPILFDDCSNAPGNKFFRCVANKLPSLGNSQPNHRAQIAALRMKNLRRNLIRLLARAQGTVRAQSAQNERLILLLEVAPSVLGLLRPTAPDLCKWMPNICIV